MAQETWSLEMSMFSSSFLSTCPESKCLKKRNPAALAIWLLWRTRLCSSPSYPVQSQPTVLPISSNFFMLCDFVEFRQTDLYLKQMRETQYELFWEKISFCKDSVSLNSYYCPGVAVYANLHWNSLNDFLSYAFKRCWISLTIFFPKEEKLLQIDDLTQFLSK